MVVPQRNYQDVVNRIEAISSSLDEVRVTHHLTSGGHTYPLLKIMLGKGNSRRVLLSAGIHGDEPAGVETLCRLLEQKTYLPFLNEWEFHILPCINPTGFQNHTRENFEGIDLNRQFKESQPGTEVRYVQHAVDEGPFDLDLELHEDVDTPGYYLYQKELNKPEGPLGRWILDAVEPIMPLNLKPEIEGIAADRGLLARLSEPEEMEWWPMALYSIVQQCKRVFTLETSPRFPMETRVNAHLKGIETALKRYQEASEIRL